MSAPTFTCSECGHPRALGVELDIEEPVPLCSHCVGTAAGILLDCPREDAAAARALAANEQLALLRAEIDPLRAENERLRDELEARAVD